MKIIELSAPLERELALHLLENIHAFRRNSRNYVGYVTEPDIVGKTQERWEKAVKVRSKSLEPVLNKALGLHVITGYHIKNLSDVVQFDVNRKIAYSHSDFTHIKQLIGLMMGEGLQAKLQLEPKRASFIFRSEWNQDGSSHLEIIDVKS